MPKPEPLSPLFTQRSELHLGGVALNPQGPHYTPWAAVQGQGVTRGHPGALASLLSAS